MPPKKQEEFDINALPPMKHLTVGLRFDCGRQRAHKLQNLLKDARSFQRNVTREEIIQFLKEKNIYVDPAQLNDKQKKDTKFMAEIATELTPEVMNKGFNLFIQEAVLNARKLKYQQQQEKLNPPPAAAVKKDDKKDTKKGKDAPPPPPPEPEKPPEKEYNKNFDLLYLFTGYPETHQEQIDLIIVIKEKVVNWGGVDMALLEQPEDFQDDITKRMEEFEQPPPIKKQLSEESQQFSQQERALVQKIKQARSQSQRNDPLRNLTIKDIILEMDLDAEDELLKQFHEQLLEEICAFSQDQQQFNDWIVTKKTQPLLTKQEPQDPFDIEVDKIKKEARDAEEQQRLQEEAILAEKNKKGAKKEAKKTEAELEAERQALAEQQRKEEARKQQIELALENQKKMKEKLHLQYYKKQLQSLDLIKTSPIILLEVLLDQHQSEQVYLATGKVPPCLEDVEDAEQVQRILQGITHPKPIIEYQQLLIDECDEIEVRSYWAKLNDQQSVSERERKIFDNLCFPGIDRFMMPEQPEKSEKLRKALKSKLHPFINVDVLEFERRQNLIQFEDLLKENEPEHEWWFGDRTYLERHNKNTLRQKFLQALLHDPQVLTKYLPDDDALIVCCYYKNPPGRVLRKKWSAEWRVLPNLENWINVRTFNSDFFYDIDYQQIGNLHERTKLLYPTDNSLIVATKYQVADKFHLRYRVIKENIVFGLRDAFYAEMNDLRLTVQLEKDDKAILNLSLKDGLCLRFTPSGDVIQKYLFTKQQQSTQTLLNLYDNAEINHELETQRIVTGMGSVIVYKKDGSIVVLYANGNVATYRNDQWTTTNNKGFKRVGTKIDKIPCATKTDPESGAIVYIRDDQTMVIKYKDGSQYTKHYDGTIMLSEKDKVTVEHPNFATVRVTLDRVKMRTDTIIGMGSAYANVGFDNIFERSNDGRLIETFVGDIKVVSYLEKQELPEYKQFKSNRINLLYLADGGVIKVVDDGEIVIVTSEERVRLNNKGEQKQLWNDLDYWLQLFSVADERKAGVYTVSLKQSILQFKLEIIFTKDEESNYFSINQDGEVISKISVSLNQEPQSPDNIPDGLFVDEENKFLPPPKSWIHPRLFLVNNDNTGVEFYNEQQLEYYLRIKSANPLCTKVVDEFKNYKSISFLTELKHVSKKFINVHIPQTLDIIPKTVQKSTQIPVRVFTYRNFLQYQMFDKEQRVQHDGCLLKYDGWLKAIQKTQNEFGVIQKSEEERDAEFMIQMRILESRKTDYSTESYDEAKSKIKIPDIKQDSESEEVTIQKSARQANTVQQALIDLQRKAIAVKYTKQPKQQKEIEVTGFVENYFETKEGIEASKKFPKEVFIVNVKPREKILGTEGTLEIQSQQHISQQQQQLFQQSQQGAPASNDPIINLENPPPQYPQVQLKPIVIKPSVFTQAEIDEEIKQKKINDDALKYRSVKRKDFDLLGKERQDIKKVPCLLKTNPKMELNQKYILTDATTENRVKISSMATRVYQHAPGIAEMRGEGMHQTIIRTLDKKNNLDDLMERKNLMISNDLNDKLRKDLLIFPITVIFGDLRLNGNYETKVCVKNEDILAQRIVIKQPSYKFIKVYMKQMGSISLGLTRDVFIQIQATQAGQFSDEFQIVSKHAIYTIPITGQILEQQIFDKVNQEQIKTQSKSLLRKHVKDLKHQNKPDVIGDSQDSDLLPRMNYDKNFKIDPYANQKKEENSYDDDQ